MERRGQLQGLMKEWTTDTTSDKTKERGPDGYHGWVWVFLKFLGNLICLQKLEFLILSNANFQHPVLPSPTLLWLPSFPSVYTGGPSSSSVLWAPGLSAWCYNLSAYLTCDSDMEMLAPSWTHWPTGLPRHSCQYCLFSAGVGNRALGFLWDWRWMSFSTFRFALNEHSSHAYGQEQFKRYWEPKVDWIPPSLCSLHSLYLGFSLLKIF